MLSAVLNRDTPPRATDRFERNDASYRVSWFGRQVGPQQAGDLATELGRERRGTGARRLRGVAGRAGRRGNSGRRRWRTTTCSRGWGTRSRWCARSGSSPPSAPRPSKHEGTVSINADLTAVG